MTRAAKGPRYRSDLDYRQPQVGIVAPAQVHVYGVISVEEEIIWTKSKWH